MFHYIPFVYFLRGGGWRRLYNGELRSWYDSPNIVRVIKSRSMRWAGHVACTGRRRNTHILIGKPDEKRPFGRPRRRWEDTIMDLRETG
jgi:hypothetical protein